MVHALVTFVIAASLLVVLAGPDSLLVLRSRTAARVLTGLAVWVVAAALGLSPLLRASHTRYSALRRLVGGWRENKLRSVHRDNVRAMRNVGTDVALVGGGVAGGSALGVGLGALIDVATLGASAGLGTTVIGPAIGASFGGRAGGKKAAEARLRPLNDARQATTGAIAGYDRAVTEATDKARTRWVNVVVPRAEKDAAERADELRRTATALLACARLELDATRRMPDADRHCLLTAAASEVDVAQRRAERPGWPDAASLRGGPPPHASARTRMCSTSWSQPSAV